MINICTYIYIDFVSYFFLIKSTYKDTESFYFIGNLSPMKQKSKHAFLYLQ